jgi:phosphodiesterase/alkaline phosphatase D-like protein
VGTCADYFPNGVAAGDVDQSSVILWARAEFAGPVTFEYGRDPDFFGVPEGVQTVMVADPIEGENLTIPAKVEFSGLDAGTQYYYRACRGETCPDKCASSVALGRESRGSFRTPHAGGHNGLRFGVSSCFRGDLKPFTAIKNVPDRDLDFFVALGDTTYADSPLTNPADDHQRGTRAQTLAEYRIKNECVYSQLSCIPEDNKLSLESNIFPLVRASTASYVTIDDHEVLNDFAGGAPPRSQKESAECTQWGICFCPTDDLENNCKRQFVNETDLFSNGLQAWYDYNPVRTEQYGQTGDPRTAKKEKLYRYRTFGKDAAIFMLDTRSFRDEPLGIEILGKPIAELPAESYERGRTMLGSAQLNELLLDLKDAQDKGIAWKFILVPEPIQNLGWFLASDRFEGYARERGQILDYIQSFCIANVVFISGDIHASIANNLVYKRLFLDLKRYSEAWDISTGPAAFGTPYGEALIDGLNTAIQDCASDPVCEALVPDNVPRGGSYFYQLTPDERNALVEDLLNSMLFIMRYPRIGLHDEDLYDVFLQKASAHIPATLLEGRYLDVNSYSWTEFEIDDVTHKLTVTTYGINPAKTGVDEVPVVSKFEVAPAARARNGTQCTNDINCSSCRCALRPDIGEQELFQCTARLADGEVCIADGQCESGRCSGIGVVLPGLQRCQRQGSDGGSCRFDSDCLTGDCSGGLCRPSPNGQSCVQDNACQSGRCSELSCKAQEPSGRECYINNDCQSGACTDDRCE